MYSWPVDVIRTSTDSVLTGTARQAVDRSLAEGGYGPRLIDMIGSLYEVADGATFFDGAFRVHPFYGMPDHQVPGVVEWNSATDWKPFAPPGGERVFYFMSNAFGDLFGVSLDAAGDIEDDQVTILWVEKYEVEVAGVGWNQALEWILTDEDETGTYLARLSEYDWATEELGKPEAWQCFSSDLPAILGGDDTIDNVNRRALPVHVSFSLQTIHAASQAETEE